MMNRMTFPLEQFSLTPALSRGERENRRPMVDTLGYYISPLQGFQFAASPTVSEACAARMDPVEALRNET
jgi:hypothetical protein